MSWRSWEASLRCSVWDPTAVKYSHIVVIRLLVVGLLRRVDIVSMCSDNWALHTVLSWIHIFREVIFINTKLFFSWLFMRENPTRRNILWGKQTICKSKEGLKPVWRHWGEYSLVTPVTPLESMVPTILSPPRPLNQRQMKNHNTLMASQCTSRTTPFMSIWGRNQSQYFLR